MTCNLNQHETLDDLRTLDFFREARERYPEVWQSVHDGSSQETKAICSTILIAGDILRRTLIAVYDAHFEATHYSP